MVRAGDKPLNCDFKLFLVLLALLHIEWPHGVLLKTEEEWRQATEAAAPPSPVSLVVSEVEFLYLLFVLEESYGRRNRW